MEDLIIIGIIVLIFLFIFLFWKWIDKRIKKLKDEIDKEKNRYTIP